MAGYTNHFLNFSGVEAENVTLWLHRWANKKELQGWQDIEAIRHASQYLGPIPYGWFATHAAAFNTWAEFSAGLQQRFADDEQGLMLRLKNRKQQEVETVQAYADEMALLFAQTHTPAASQRDMFLDNLKPSLQKRVINTCPESLQEAIRKAKFLESQDLAHSPQKLKALQEQGNSSKTQSSAVDELCRTMKDLTLHLTQVKPKTGDRDVRPPRRAEQGDRPALTCFKCGNVGHKAVDCPTTAGAPRVQNHAGFNLFQVQGEEEEEDLPAYDGSDYVVAQSTATQQPALYATDGRATPMQRTPRNRTAFTPEQIRARVRGSQGADNPAAGPPRPNVPGPPPRSADTGRAAAGTPFPRSRQTGDLDIVGQLGATPVKLSFGALLQEAPRCRQDLRYFLDRVEGIAPSNAPTPAPPRSAAPRQSQQGQGPTPMETHFETEVAYHADYSLPKTNSVLKGTVGIFGRAFDCIIDTGASHSVLSHSVVRRLGMLDNVEPSQNSYVTAAGKPERPMGILDRVPITMGSLTLEIDAMVTYASTYHVLIGNDWLQMASADILLSSNLIRLRLGRDVWEEIPIQANTGAPRINMFFPENAAGLWQAAEQCADESPEAEDIAQQCFQDSHWHQLQGNLQEVLTSGADSLPSFVPSPESIFDGDMLDGVDEDEDTCEDKIAAYWPNEPALQAPFDISTLQEHTGEDPTGEDHTGEVHAGSILTCQPSRDTTDWQFDAELFQSYNLLYGPFQVDACSDNAGYNALCPVYWCADDSCLQHSWTGKSVWCNPPFQQLSDILTHAVECFQQDPANTRALLVVPDWPQAAFWKKMQECTACQCVGYYPAGTELFTAPPVQAGAGRRRAMSPTSWGVLMVLISRRTQGVGIPWAPWPPVAPPTLVKVDVQHKELADGEWPAVSIDLDARQVADMEGLLCRYSSVFASGGNTGRTNVVTHSIDTGDAGPIRQPAHRLSAEERQVQREEVLKMLQAGVIVPSNSPWASPVVLVGKKDGSKRFCVDYRGLNNITRKDVYPLSRTEEVLDELGNARYFSKLDLKSGYWQIIVDPADRAKTAFTTRDGLYEFVVMPFGLTSAPATFQRLMDTVLQGLLWEKAMVYLDDIIIYSRTWEEHVVALDQVLGRLRAANLQASGSKCALAQSELLYLGHLVTRQGILPDDSNVANVVQAPSPQNVRAVRSFLGMANYYSQFIQNFAQVAKPLYQLTKKDADFEWTEDCEVAFQVLKHNLSNAPLLRRPDTSLPFILQTDWSPVAIGAVLTQADDLGYEHPVAFASRALRGAELRYSATEGECFALVHFVEHFRPYLHGVQFTVQMDHAALKWLMTGPQKNARCARWALKLQGYMFEVRHRKGADHANADAMSRPPIASPLQAPVISVMQTLGADHLSDGEITISYAKEGEDSGPSVPEELECEVCRKPTEADVMLVCSRCQAGYHTFCLDPPLQAVPEGDWFCPKHTSGTTSRSQETKKQIAGGAQVTETWSGSASSDFTFDQVNAEPQVLDITEDAETLQFLEHHSFPDASSDSDKARIRRNASRYSVQDGVLLHKETHKPVPYTADRRSIVAGCHKLGHFGVRRTVSLVQQSYWWWGITEAVKEVVSACPECKLMRHSFAEPVEMTPIPVKYAFHKVGIDLVGPLQVTSAGNKYIVTCIDYLSKWVEARALPDKTSKQVAHFFYADIVCRHGTPAEVISDQGGEFQGDFQDLLDRLCIDHRMTSPYHPQANGLTERFNQTCVRSLRKMTQTTANWDLELPTVLLGYRASVQASTQYTPFHILHGQDMQLPMQQIARLQAPEVGCEDPTAQALVDNLKPLQEVLTQAHANIKAAQQKQMTHYAARHLHGATPTGSGTPTSAGTPTGSGADSCTADEKGKAIKSVAVCMPPSDPEKPTPDEQAPLRTAGISIAGKRGPRAPRPLQVDDFVVARIHKMVRTAGDRKGKLVPQVEGPYCIDRFTDDTHQIAILVDGGGLTWKKRTADLSLNDTSDIIDEVGCSTG